MSKKVNNPSSRHHFLPEFYLKEFTHNEGFFYVYDKLKDKIDKRKKYPKSYFFEWDRNTTELNGSKNDLLEKLYKSIDDRFSETYIQLVNILQKEEKREDRTKIITEMLIFINSIRWRVPSRDSISFNILNDYDFDNLSYFIANIKTGERVDNQETISFFKDLEIFQKSQGTLIVFEPFFDKKHIVNVQKKVSILSNLEYSGIICDNPYIEKNVSKDIKSFNEFIFPLTQHHIAIFLEDLDENNFDEKLTFRLELAKIENAERYVACANKNNLENLVLIYQQLRDRGLRNRLIPDLFKSLERDNDK